MVASPPINLRDLLSLIFCCLVEMVHLRHDNWLGLPFLPINLVQSIRQGPCLWPASSNECVKNRDECFAAGIICSQQSAVVSHIAADHPDDHIYGHALVLQVSPLGCDGNRPSKLEEYVLRF